jgi:fibronectin type 3 domain-containing protein
MSDGNYTVIVTAKDTAGNVSDAKEVNYRLNVEPPSAPVLTASAGDFKTVLSWTCGKESDLEGFLIYRSMVQNSFNDYECINSTKNCSYTDDRVEPGKTYYYMVKAVDIRGNSSWSNKAQVIPTDKDNVLPVAVAEKNQTAIVGMEVELDGRESYDNDRIASYEWDFGDGNTAKTARAYIFTQRG